jgi:mannose/fructose-specific phosphotransferase system component IIA
MIVGALPRFVAVSIGWHKLTTAGMRLRRRLSASGARGVLILTDMFSGTRRTWAWRSANESVGSSPA